VPDGMGEGRALSNWETRRGDEAGPDFSSPFLVLPPPLSSKSGTDGDERR